MATKIFVDFDGTITDNDVGNAFFETFGGPQCGELVRTYREGRISAAECFTGEALALGSVDPVEAGAFVRSFPIDRTFRTFLVFSRERNYEVVIVSDGLDYYAEEIFDANGLSDVRLFANRATFLPTIDGRRVSLSIQYPFSDSVCTRCACCKRNIMLARSGDEDAIVYVGEGYSDTCPVEYADVVFAKASLQTHCQRENITYYPYSTFDDIVDRIEKLTVGGRQIRKRQRAEMKRREAFRLE